MIRNETLLKKAEALKPELLVTSQELFGEDRVLNAGNEAIPTATSRVVPRPIFCESIS